MQLKLKLTVAAAIAAIAGVAAAQEVVRIGHVAPISGAQAHYGKDNENGSRMAIEELNAQGVEIGGKKVKFELLAEDDAADPKQANKWTGYLVGGTSPFGTKTVLPVYVEASILALDTIYINGGKRGFLVVKQAADLQVLQPVAVNVAVDV